MCAKYYENPTMLSQVTAKNVRDVFFQTHCSIETWLGYNNEIIIYLILIIHGEP